MSNEAEPAAGAPVEHRIIRNPQDFYGGLALAALALFAFWAGSDLPGMHGFSFGPGTAPRLFAGLLLAFGLGIAAIGYFTDGPALEAYGVRGPMMILVAIFAFAAMIRPLGLVVSSFLTFMIAATASAETRWIESTITAVVLTAFCTFLFPYLLNLPFQIWPQF
jgi:putative tricarboxylic transport membrane protein